LDTTCLTPEQRKYLPLLQDLWTESPVREDDGRVLNFEDVVATLDRTWLSYGCGMGLNGGGFKPGSFNHIFALTCQMQLAKVKEGFDWVRKLLWNTAWSGARAKVVANKMAGDIPELKRKSTRLASAIIRDIVYKNTSNAKTASLVRQHKFLKDLSKEKDNDLEATFTAIQTSLLKPDNVTVHLSCSLNKLKETIGEDFSELLVKTFPFKTDGTQPKIKRLANQQDSEWMNDLSKFDKKAGYYVLGNRTEDNSFMVKLARGINDWKHPDLPCLLTTLSYLCQTEVCTRFSC